MSANSKRKKLEQKVADAKYMSKPHAENAMVVRDTNGRWIFEVYLAGRSAENGNAPTGANR